MFVKSFYCLLCIFVFLLNATNGDKSDALNTLKKIKDNLSSHGVDVTSTVSLLQSYISGLSSSSKNLSIIETGLETTWKTIKRFESGTAAEIIVGALDISSTVFESIPVASSFFKLLSSAFSIIGAVESNSMQNIVRGEITRALNNYDDSQLRAEANGVDRLYQTSFSFLKTETDLPLAEHEVGALASHVPIYQGVKFLGTLERKITENARKRDTTQIKRAMEYLKLYVELSILRSALLWQMYSIVRGAGHSPRIASGIRNVAVRQATQDKHFLQFITERTSDSSFFLFYTYFNPSEWPLVIQYMNAKGLQFPDLSYLVTSNKHYYLRSLKYPTWYVRAPEAILSDPLYGINKVPPERRGEFYFSEISPKHTKDSIFYFRFFSMYIQVDPQSVIGNDRVFPSNWKRGTRTEWKVVKLGDVYMLSALKWLDNYMYMSGDQWGTIKVHTHPGDGGKWYFDEV